MNVPELPSEFVIFDTEYTAWEGSHARGWSAPGEYREIIQIGAVLVRELTEVDSLVLYVKPTINPELSQYIIELTGVTQETIDVHGQHFSAAYDAFMQFIAQRKVYSFGGDEEQLQENHDLNHTRIQVPNEQFHDARMIFESVGIDTHAYSSGTIPQAFGCMPPPHAHDALNDCRSILLALQAVYTTG